MVSSSVRFEGGCLLTLYSFPLVLPCAWSHGWQALLVLVSNWARSAAASESAIIGKSSSIGGGCRQSGTSPTSSATSSLHLTSTMTMQCCFSHWFSTMFACWRARRLNNRSDTDRLMIRYFRGERHELPCWAALTTYQISSDVIQVSSHALISPSSQSLRCDFSMVFN